MYKIFIHLKSARERTRTWSRISNNDRRIESFVSCWAVDNCIKYVRYLHRAFSIALSKTLLFLAIVSEKMHRAIKVHYAATLSDTISKYSRHSEEGNNNRVSIFTVAISVCLSASLLILGVCMEQTDIRLNNIFTQGDISWNTKLVGNTNFDKKLLYFIKFESHL